LENFYDWLKLNEYNNPRKGMKSRWSVKYKKSINCKNPKGFSQKNYCKRKSRGGNYLESNMYFGKEDVNIQQVDRLYDKSDLAVKCVQLYDKITNKNFLTDITTVVPFQQKGLYGLFNSADNRLALGSYDKNRFIFSPEEIQKLADMPTEVLKKYKVPQEILNLIQNNDVQVQVNINDIYNDVNAQVKAKKLDKLSGQLEIIKTLASTIIHEVTHLREYRRKRADMGEMSGEVGPEREEKLFETWFDQSVKNGTLKTALPELFIV